jgi:hypothetical protein
MGNTMGVLFSPPEQLSSHSVYGIYDWVCVCLFFFFINLSSISHMSTHCVPM